MPVARLLPDPYRAGRDRVEHPALAQRRRAAVQYGQRALLRRLTGAEHRRVDEADAVPLRQTRQPLGVPKPTVAHCTHTPLGETAGSARFKRHC